MQAIVMTVPPDQRSLFCPRQTDNEWVSHRIRKNYRDVALDKPEELWWGQTRLSEAKNFSTKPASYSLLLVSTPLSTLKPESRS